MYCYATTPDDVLPMVDLQSTPSIQRNDEQIKTLYSSLNPTSISQHLAFLELYSDHPTGNQALKYITELLSGNKVDSTPSFMQDIVFSYPSLLSLIDLVNRPVDAPIKPIDPNLKEFLSRICQTLHHTSLKGHFLWTEEDILKLDSDEIDLARGLFLSQMGENRPLIEAYEAYIDLMALQVSIRLPKEASPEMKINAINSLFFDEMGFRFPPHSIYAKNIDLYTFLPSVLDSRKGVCLGVSILYMCVAQRLDLPLEMITPPGHIYVRYRKENKVINIETTARGIHLDSEEYLSVNNKALQSRSVKEVIGLAHFNQASVYWQNGEYEKALSSYTKARQYMPEDHFAKELLGYISILTGHKEEGEKLIHEIKDYQSPYAIAQNTMAEDFCMGKIDAEGISTVFKKVDEDRKSILEKKQKLEETLQKFPDFRAGRQSLAITWLQLHRTKEALESLEKLKNEKDPEVHYYLSILYAERKDYPKAWHHLQQAEHITNDHHYKPKPLKDLRRELLILSAEPEPFSLKRAYD